MYYVCFVFKAPNTIYKNNKIVVLEKTLFFISMVKRKPSVEKIVRPIEVWKKTFFAKYNELYIRLG